MQSVVLWCVGWAVGKTGGWEGVDVGGTPCAGGSQRPQEGRNWGCFSHPALWEINVVGSQPAVLCWVTLEPRQKGVMCPLSPYQGTLSKSPMEKVNQGSTIKLHDYKVPCHPILSMPLSTLRTPPGSHVADCRKHDNLQDHGNAGSQSTRLSVFPYTLHILFIMCCLP